MATRTTTESVSALSRGPRKALVVGALAVLAIIAAIAVANVVSDDESAATVAPAAPVAAPIAVSEGVPPRGGLAETIAEQQAPVAVSEGVPPRGGLAEAIQEQEERHPLAAPSCDGPAELTGIC
jgi:hypothetical protein